MKLLKRTVSVLLAMLMLFSSFSVLSSATLGDDKEETMVLDTRFFREETGADGETSWVETTKAARGDKIRARVYIDTDFYVGTSYFFWLYDSTVLSVDNTEYEAGTILNYVGIVNPDSKSVASKIELNFDFKHFDGVDDGTSYHNLANLMVDWGYLPEGIYKDHGYIYAQYGGGTKVAKYTSEDYKDDEDTTNDVDNWMFEFHFTVNKDADINDTANLCFPVSCLITSDDLTWDAASMFSWCPAEDDGLLTTDAAYVESYEWDPYIVNKDQDEDSTLTLKSSINFVAEEYDANGEIVTEQATEVRLDKDGLPELDENDNMIYDPVVDKNGDPVMVTSTIDVATYSGLVKDASGITTIPTAPEVSGKAFKGWADSEGNVLTDDQIKALAFDYEDTTLTAVYATSGVTAKINAVYTDVVTNQQKTDLLKTVSSVAGNKVKIVEKMPSEEEKDANVTYVLMSDLASVEHYQLAAGNTLEVEVKEDSSSVLNLAYEPVSYKVIFNNENGSLNAEKTGTYYSAIETPTPDEKNGYTFAGWYDADGNKLADDAKFVANATYTATYAPKTDTAYTVEIYTMDINGVYGEAEVVPNTVGTTGETATYTAAPGTGLYLDTENSTKDLSTTITADDTDVIKVYYARNAYEVTVDDVAQAEKVYHGATFTTPTTSTTTETGYTLTGWSDGATTYGKGAAVTVTGALNLTAINEANDHSIIYTVDGTWPENYEEPDAKAVKYNSTFKLADLAEVAPVTGYAFSGWTVVSGATYDDATDLYTVTGDVEVIGEWTHTEYTISYYLTEDDYTAGNAYHTAPYYYNDTIEAYEPDQLDILGKEFIEWETVAGEAMPAAMPEGNLAVIASTNDYEVIFYDEYGDVSAEYYGIETVTEADAPDMTSDEFDFGGWLVNGETDATKAVETFSYDITGNYYFKPVCTVNVVYYEDYDENGAPTGEYKTLVYDFGYTPAADDAQLAALGTPTKEGHAFDSWDFDIVDNELTSHNYAVAQWTAKAYTATFNAVNGELAGAFADSTTTKTVENVTYGTEITFADVPVLAGYTFQGWTDVEGGTVKVDPLTMNKEGKTFYAIYTANGQAGYTVEIYLMGTDGKYAAEATDKDTTKTGTIGVEATAAHADYAQDSIFSADTENENNVTSAVVAADGSTVLKLYYKRATVQITVNDETKDYYVGEEIVIDPVPDDEIEDGYKQDEENPWIDENGDPVEVPYEVKEDGNPTEIKPNIVARDDTAYTVNIYTMDINGGYGEAEVVPGTVGTTGKTATYTAAPGEGLYLDAEMSTKDLSTTITADDTDVINVYYARNAYEVTVDGVAQTEKVYHGATFTTPTTSTTTEAGYTLTGWTDAADNSYGKGAAVTVTGALNLTAVNTANTDTAYKVEIYLMNENGDYVLRDTDLKTGTTDTLATAAHADYIAYIDSFYSADTENENNVTSATITGDGEAVLKLYYKRAQYEVTVDGVVQADKVYHGATFTAPTTSTTTEAGYTLTGWTDGAANYNKGDVITVTGALNLTAVNTANTDTAYKVEIYLMGTDGTYGAAAETKTKTGTTGGDATAAHADYIAELDAYYSADDSAANVTSDKIAGNGSTTLKLYYKRASYSYSFTANGTAVESGTAYHGATIKTPAYTPDAGFTFGGWTNGTDTYAANTNITVESDLAYTAIINANTGITYKVETHVMNTDGTTYEVTTETFSGKTGDTVAANHVAMDGFTPDLDNSVLTGTIAADGSTVLKVVYSRDKYTITIDDVTDEYYYGEEIPLTPVPEDEIPEGHEQDAEKPWVDENGDPVDNPYIVDEDNPTEIKPNIVPSKYTVEFTVAGKTFVSAEAEYGTAIQNPGTPGAEWIPEGHSFGGWSVDGVTEVTDFGTVGVDGNTFVAILNKLSYSLTFKDAEGNVLSGPTSTEFGSTLATLAPTAPDKADAGLIFAGWVEEGNATATMPATMPAKDVVYVASYVQNTTPVEYTIEVYMMDTNGDYTLSAATVSYGYIGTTQTIKAGNVVGCSVDADKSVLSGVIEADGTTVLKIYYARDIYTVTFGDNAPVDVYYGAAIPVPADDPVSTEEGMVFAGWTPAVPATMPAENLVFEATWEPGVYTITYVINGETKDPISYTYGDAVATPDTPDVDGLKFLGWTPEVPKTMPAKDLIIVAEFEADLFKVTFLDDVDGEVFDVKYVEYGEAITLPTGEPTKEYHTFEGWLAVPETMPAEDIVIVPDFAPIPVSLIEQEGSTTVIDRDRMIIYGLDTRMRASEYDDIYLDVVGDGYFTVTPAEGKAGFYGTGTVIELYDNNSVTGDPIETYYVVIFGDVNGDSDVNAADASAVEDEYFWVTGWSREGSDDYAYYKLIAGDLDNDGDIDVNDHTNIVNYTVGVIAIDQTTGTVDR